MLALEENLFNHGHAVSWSPTFDDDDEGDYYDDNDDDCYDDSDGHGLDLDASGSDRNCFCSVSTVNSH